MNNKLETITEVLDKSQFDLSLLKAELFEELKSLLDFWSSEALDTENGGVIGKIDHYGNRYKEASKGSILHSRLLWTFSSAYRITRNKAYKSVADSVYEYIINHFWDEENGGLYWELDFTGNPINKRKQAYAQGFGIYAFSEYYRATNNAGSLNFAKALFNILEDKFKEPRYSGYIEALQYDWAPIDDMRLSEKDQNAPKSMNTHLHILEPYTNLYRVWPDDKLKTGIQELIAIFQDKIMDKDSGHFNLFFELDWNVRSNTISFGHDIEGAWLIHEAAEVIQDTALIHNVRQTSLKLANITLKKGLDTDGSVFNEYENNQYDKDKHWWPQAEAMVGFMDAFEMEPKQEYIKAIFNIWSFIKNYLIDRENGEWFWRVDEHGNPNPDDDKLGFWKCPYHNSRALVELIERIDKIKNQGNARAHKI
ncbi:AGE family epimerase/isomerase [Seonamhaeicola sp.]|uniref:AGE family epimerase/isomerase n=1 Tax=Seonamhaeicola sp. TaxID=1912245 RepID=UPI00262AF3D1|nr:AGE family epimerase/isomerase [Seonamhaeicola sp.]